MVITAGLGFLLMARMFRSLTALYGYSLFFGLAYGAIAPLNMALAADRFAGNRFGLIYGILFLGTSLGAALGPLVWGLFLTDSRTINRPSRRFLPLFFSLAALFIRSS
jgi:MFS family permease